MKLFPGKILHVLVLSSHAYTTLCRSCLHNYRVKPPKIDSYLDIQMSSFYLSWPLLGWARDIEYVRKKQDYTHSTTGIEWLIFFRWYLLLYRIDQSYNRRHQRGIIFLHCQSMTLFTFLFLESTSSLFPELDRAAVNACCTVGIRTA